MVITQINLESRFVSDFETSDPKSLRDKFSDLVFMHFYFVKSATFIILINALIYRQPLECRLMWIP